MEVQDVRVKYSIGFIIILFLMLVIRLGYLQIGRHAYYWNLSESNRIQMHRDPAPRGKILDCRGGILAANRPSFKIRYRLSQVRMNPDKIIELANLVGMDWKALAEKLQEPYQNHILAPVELVEDADLMTVAQVEEHLTDFPGIFVDYEPVRFYEYHRLAAHLLGYVSEITQEELKKLRSDGYYLGDVIGRGGVEEVCERYLRGRFGWRQLEVDARGREIRLMETIAPRPGYDVYLTIDARIQRIVEEAFGERYQGAAVVLDPRNGAILAMVSKPDFDPNVFAWGITPEEWKELTEDESHPLINRVIQGVYPSGSLFKVVTAAAALEEGITDRDRIIMSTGEFRLGDQVFKDWKKEGHGATDIIKAIAQSVNSYFYQIGYELGEDLLAKYAREFGLGSPTGIDIPGEKKGLVPTAKWKRSARGEGWYPGDTVNMSIGQGFILVTPLQVANMYSAIANGGVIYKPQIIQKIVSEDGRVVYSFEKRVLRKLSLSDSTLAILREGLRQVVKEGTARYPFMGAKVEVAGKTGTAQSSEGEPHAWFVGYTPPEDPKLLVTLLVEHGGVGAGIAAQLARQVLENSLSFIVQVAQKDDGATPGGPE